MSYSEQEFEQAMADLADVHVKWGKSGGIVNMVVAGHWPTGSFTPFSDLNQLMPLFFEYCTGIYEEVKDKKIVGWECAQYEHFITFNTDPVKAIRDCLFELSQERKV